MAPVERLTAESVRVRRPFRCLLGRHRWVRMDTIWIMHICTECQKERVWLP